MHTRNHRIRESRSVRVEKLMHSVQGCRKLGPWLVVPNGCKQLIVRTTRLGCDSKEKMGIARDGKKKRERETNIVERTNGLHELGGATNVTPNPETSSYWHSCSVKDHEAAP